MLIVGNLLHCIESLAALIINKTCIKQILAEVLWPQLPVQLRQVVRRLPERSQGRAVGGRPRTWQRPTAAGC